jgi:hypothetical protein
MSRLFLLLVLLLMAGTAMAQTGSGDPKSPFYPAPPPEKAPEVDQGASLQGLTSPLVAGEQKVARTVIESDAEAQLFANAAKIVWGRYAKIKGAKPGEVQVAKQNGVWSVKGRIDSVAPETEGDWASIDAVVERIATGQVMVRGEVAFRIAKLQGGKACKVAGTLHFKRSGKSHVWRLVEGDNPCDGNQEFFDLVYERPVEKRPVPAAAPAKRT